MKVDVPLLDKVRRWLPRLGPNPGRVVVAVSGGPDSVALLRALAALGVAPLVVAHLNHQLRGAESDADERFVSELHAQVQASGVPVQLEVERLDVAAQALAAGANLESVAREARYSFLLRVAQETASRWIATGHTADDQAETVLHRLLRGTGLQGLRGIASRRDLTPDIAVVRPLLDVPRSEVLAYLEAAGQASRHDSSNTDRRFTRNRIRLELLPLLAEHYNPAVASVLCRLAAQAEEVWRETDALTVALLHEAECPRAGAILVFDRARLSQATGHLVREMFRRVWEREGWPRAEMTFAAWERLAAVVRGETPNIDLPGGVRVRGQERVVQVERA